MTMSSISADNHYVSAPPCQDHRRNQTCCCPSRKRKCQSDEPGVLTSQLKKPRESTLYHSAIPSITTDSFSAHSPASAVPVPSVTFASASRSSKRSPPSIFRDAAQPIERAFEIDSHILGSGKFGTVRRCTCRSTGVQYACKTISKATLIEAEDIEDVRREVRLLQQVAGHPGVMRLHTVFEDDMDVHLVTELCDGGDLFDEVARRGRFSELHAAQVFMQIASAVAFCHSRGVMHRDIKPENILLSSSPLLPSSTLLTHITRLHSPSNLAESSEQSQPLNSDYRADPHRQPSYHSVKLADFGLAVPLDRGETATGAAGSPYYMAPEVIKGHYGFHADVWSLGVVLHILLTGSPPFWGSDDQGILDSVLNGRLDVSAESGVWAGVSAEARGLIRCMLERDPRRRPTASKVLSHPWLLLHAFGGRIVRKAARGGNYAEGCARDGGLEGRRVGEVTGCGGEQGAAPGVTASVILSNVGAAAGGI